MKKSTIQNCPCNGCICVPICSNKEYKVLLEQCKLLSDVVPFYRYSSELDTIRAVDSILKSPKWIVVKAVRYVDGKKVTQNLIQKLEGMTRKEFKRKLDKYEEEYNIL